MKIFHAMKSFRNCILNQFSPLKKLLTCVGKNGKLETFVNHEFGQASQSRIEKSIKEVDVMNEENWHKRYITF